MQLKINLNKNKGFWNFYQHGVSQSLINKFRECPVQCKLAYYDGWTSTKYSEALHFGNTVHYVLAELYGTDTLPLAGEILRKLREYKDIWAKENMNSELSMSQEQQWEKVYAAAEAVLLEYFDVPEYKSDFKHNWLYTEKEFKVPFSFSMPYTGEKVDTVLRGKIDGGFETPGGLELIDHKCKGVINTEALIAMLPYDTQCNMYLLSQLLITGKMPQAIKYNIIRIPQSRPKVNEPLDDFVASLRDKISRQRDHYFFRIRLQITEKEIIDWQDNWLIPNLVQIKRWFDSECKNLTINPEALYSNKYGLSDFFHLITTGSTQNVYKRKHVFPELESDPNSNEDNSSPEKRN